MSFAWIVLSYLLGSIPVGLLLSKLKGRDPRKIGSGNIGATNVMRTAGKKLGLITLAGDILKGLLPTALAQRFGLSDTMVGAIAFAVFVGHLFPVYLKFRGGKGIATSLGIFIVLSPIAILVDVIVFAALLLKWGYVSLGSIVAAALMPIILVLGSALHITPARPAYVILSIIMAILIVIKHGQNIARLRAGTERKIVLKDRAGTVKM